MAIFAALCFFQEFLHLFKQRICLDNFSCFPFFVEGMQNNYIIAYVFSLSGVSTLGITKK